VDLQGHDALFQDNNSSIKLSFKTEKSPIATRKGVIDITLSNQQEKQININQQTIVHLTI
jgi:hypothetical protein